MYIVWGRDLHHYSKFSARASLRINIMAMLLSQLVSAILISFLSLMHLAVSDRPISRKSSNFYRIPHPISQLLRTLLRLAWSSTPRYPPKYSIWMATERYSHCKRPLAGLRTPKVGPRRGWVCSTHSTS